MEKKPPVIPEAFNATYVFREQGANSNVRQRPDLAVKAFAKALTNAPHDKRALLGRADAELTLYQTALAERDADQVSVKFPLLCQAKSFKFTGQYRSGEFEAALVGNRCGLRVRRFPDYFDHGTMVAEETIEDCIGRNVGPVLNDSFRTIQAMLADEELHRNDTEPVVLTEGQVIRKQKRLDKMSRLYAEKYLGRLAKDKLFLDQFVLNPNLASPNKQGTAKIRQVAVEASIMLRERVEVLRERKPFFALKYHEATLSTTLQRRRQEEFDRKQWQARETAKHVLDKLRDARVPRDLKVYLDVFELALESFEGVSERVLPKKQSFLEATYNITSLAYLDHMRANAEREPVEQPAYIRQDLGLPAEPSSSPQLHMLRMPIVDVRKQIKDREQRLVMVMSTTEKTWLFYELSRLNFEIGKLDVSRLFAKKCVSEARDLGHLAWCVNAGMALARIEVVQRNKTDTNAALMEALEAAKHMKDEAVIKYLRKALDLVEDCDFETIGLTGIEAREKRVIQLMAGTGVKEEMAYLFRRMKMMDPNRRMSIMVGVPVPARPKKEGDAQHSQTAVKTTDPTGKRTKQQPEGQSAVAPTSIISKRRSVAPPVHYVEDN